MGLLFALATGVVLVVLGGDGVVWFVVVDGFGVVVLLVWVVTISMPCSSLLLSLFDRDLEVDRERAVGLLAAVVVLDLVEGCCSLVLEICTKDDLY